MLKFLTHFKNILCKTKIIIIFKGHCDCNSGDAKIPSKGTIHRY